MRISTLLLRFTTAYSVATKQIPLQTLEGSQMHKRAVVRVAIAVGGLAALLYTIGAPLYQAG
jgi:hypothetical protein